MLKSVETVTEQDWDKALSVNIKGLSWCSKHCVEYMKKRGKGAIVNLSSISAFVAQPDFVPYSATKAAILGITKNLAYDFAQYNVRVNSVAPGVILTTALKKHLKETGKPIQGEEKLHMMNRVGQPREVAFAILFLASDEASFITGTNLMVDGGFMGLKFPPPEKKQ